MLLSRPIEMKGNCINRKVLYIFFASVPWKASSENVSLALHKDTKSVYELHKNNCIRHTKTQIMCVPTYVLVYKSPKGPETAFVS